MKFFSTRQTPSADQTTAPIDRRKLVLGAGVAGAAAVAVQAIRPDVATVAPVDVAAAPAEGGDGYQLTPHVLRYYETAKV
jgi:hypothetical protein